MTDFTYHTLFESIGMVTVGVLILAPIGGLIWDLSAAHYRRQLAKK